MTFATTLSRVAALCLLAGAAHAASTPVSVPAADSSLPVPATVYAPAAGYRRAAPEPAGPAQVWREQNRIVAGGDAMPAMHDHGAMHGAAQAKPAAAQSSAPAKAAAGVAASAHAGHQHGGHH